MEAYILNLKPVTGAKVLDQHLPNFKTATAKSRFVSFFENIAALGIYSYNFNTFSLDGAYVLIALPEQEIKVDVFPDEIQRLLKRTILTNDVFINNEKIYKSAVT